LADGMRRGFLCATNGALVAGNDARGDMESGNETASHSAALRPTSCASGWVALVGLAGFFLSLALMHGAALSPIHRSFAALAATLLPVVVVDLFVLRIHRRPSTGLLWTAEPAAG